MIVFQDIPLFDEHNMLCQPDKPNTVYKVFDHPGKTKKPLACPLEEAKPADDSAEGGVAESGSTSAPQAKPAMGRGGGTR